MNTKKKPIEQKKTRQFTMWVSEGELLHLRKQAQINDMTMSQYIRHILLFNTINKSDTVKKE